MIRILRRWGVVAAMLFFASSAQAAPGFNLAWSACHGEATATSNRAFACDSNAGSNLLVVSFELNDNLPQVWGNEIVLDVLSNAPALPAWWDMFGAGTCRPTSLTVNSSANPGTAVCLDWTAGQATAFIGAYNDIVPVGSIDPSLQNQHRQLIIAEAVPGDLLQDLVAGTEYFACNIRIDNLKTVGTGACAGCTEPVCIVLNYFLVTTPVAANNIYLGFPSFPGSNIVTWQGTGPDCQAVPTRNRTWGQVKALFR